MSSPLDNSPAHLAEARAFARSLNILAKYGRLFGVGHARTLAQMEAAWNELSSVLSRTGHPGLLLGVAGDDLLVDGEPVGDGGSERAFARLLAAARVASLQFSPAITYAEFTRFACALAVAPGPEELGTALRSALAGQSSIRINEVCFVSGESGTPPPMFPAEVPAPAAAQRSVPAWLHDPAKLLQLISAAEASASGGVKLPAAAAETLEDLHEERELVAILRVLAQLGESANIPGGAQAGDVLPTLPPGMRAALHSAATRLAGAPQRGEEPLLVQLAVQLAVRFAVRAFERGELPIGEAPAVLGRVAGEISDLKRIVTALDRRAARFAAAAEPMAMAIERQFWAAIPEMSRRRVLLSDQAWGVPFREVSAYVERMLARSDFDSARRVLRRYSLSVTSREARGRRRAAAGLHEMAPLIGQVDTRLLGTAIRDVAWQLRRERDPEAQLLLSSAFARLSHEAAAFHRYAAFEQSLEMLEKIEQALPQLGAELRAQVVSYERLPGFLDTALQARKFPPDLVRILRRMPEATARIIAARFSRAARTLERERLVALAYELGAAATARMTHELQFGAAAEAVATVGLLARLTPELLANVLPERLQAWGAQAHGAVVSQLASSGAAGRGRMLLALLDGLDSTALPPAIDEIGISGESVAAPRLMEIAFAAPQDARSPYIQVKAIEALGRLRVAEAVEPLRKIVRERALFRWAHPDEMRIAAAEALCAIDAEAFRALPAARVLAMAAMGVPAANKEWARQRRYVRVMPPNPCRGIASSPRISTTLDITSLSLSGGLATTEKRAAAYRHATLELPLGMRKIKAEVVMQDRGPRQVSFEFVNMGLDDRRKLRRYLASQMPGPAAN